MRPMQKSPKSRLLSLGAFLHKAGVLCEVSERLFLIRN